MQLALAESQALVFLGWRDLRRPLVIVETGFERRHAEARGHRQRSHRRPRPDVGDVVDVADELVDELLRRDQIAALGVDADRLGAEFGKGLGVLALGAFFAVYEPGAETVHLQRRGVAGLAVAAGPALRVAAVDLGLVPRKVDLALLVRDLLTDPGGLGHDAVVFGALLVGEIARLGLGRVQHGPRFGDRLGALFLQVVDFGHQMLLLSGRQIWASASRRRANSRRQGTGGSRVSRNAWRARTATSVCG